MSWQKNNFVYRIFALCTAHKLLYLQLLHHLSLKQVLQILKGALDKLALLVSKTVKQSARRQWRAGHGIQHTPGISCTIQHELQQLPRSRQ
jgi:hypothetical protein